MRLFWTIELALILLLGSISYAVEIVIKTPGDEKKEEEKKEEKEEVELPKRGKLDINAKNLTEYTVVITARVDGLSPYTGIISQNLIPPNTPMTLASLYTAKPDEKFKFAQAEVILMGEEHTQAITCNIKYPEPKKEEKQEQEEEKPKPAEAVLTIPMDLGAAKKPDAEEEQGDEKKEEKKTENSLNQAPDAEKSPEPLNEINGSLDFYIYKAEGQAFPACLIHLK